MPITVYSATIDHGYRSFGQSDVSDVKGHYAWESSAGDCLHLVGTGYWSDCFCSIFVKFLTIAICDCPVSRSETLSSYATDLFLVLRPVTVLCPVMRLSCVWFCACSVSRSAPVLYPVLRLFCIPFRAFPVSRSAPVLYPVLRLFCIPFRAFPVSRSAPFLYPVMRLFCIPFRAFPVSRSGPVLYPVLRLFCIPFYACYVSRSAPFLYPVPSLSCISFCDRPERCSAPRSLNLGCTRHT